MVLLGFELLEEVVQSTFVSVYVVFLWFLELGSRYSKKRGLLAGWASDFLVGFGKCWVIGSKKLVFTFLA